ncbi:Signal peptidase, peptidase S26B [Thermococcus gammatolerans EJ3]|uniref:Signal peptidase, peptidase S26B n=1 Tax=Thermococcus gammatolerans (strain DSM 15229 / JCM 11827 / EJ3) TaxID=593117 RepID=C5A2W7_THEGJ|nr:Signal peptidase, peptidase S26B [Thermococcus gammatolerans EJ3]
MTLRSKVLSLFSAFFLVVTLLVAVLHFSFGFQYVVVLTDSMKPNINPGDLVVIYPSRDVHPGDVVLYRIELGGTEYRIIHRVVAIRTDQEGRIYYVTKGDNRKYTDPWRVYPDQVVGKLLFVIPYVGRLYYYLPLIITALILSLMAIIGYELVKILLEEEEKPSKGPAIVLRRSRDMYMLRRSRRPGRGRF